MPLFVSTVRRKIIAVAHTPIPIPRIRLTVRWMMLVVVLAAIAFLIVRWFYLSSEHQRLVDKYQDEEKIVLSLLVEEQRRNYGLYPLRVHYYEKLVQHFASLQAKHSRAVRYPWLTVAPDPPTPEPPPALSVPIRRFRPPLDHFSR